MENMIGLYGELYDRLSGLHDSLVSETADTIIGEHKHVTALLSSSICAMQAKDMKIRKSLCNTKSKTILFMDVPFKAKQVLSELVVSVDVPKDADNDWFLQELGLSKQNKDEEDLVTPSTDEEVSSSIVNSEVNDSPEVVSNITDINSDVSMLGLISTLKVDETELVKTEMVITNSDDFIPTSVLDDLTYSPDTLVKIEEEAVEPEIEIKRDVRVGTMYEIDHIDLAPLLKKEPVNRINYNLQVMNEFSEFDTLCRADDLVKEKYRFGEVNV